jgi:hypothetical protein
MSIHTERARVPNLYVIELVACVPLPKVARSAWSILKVEEADLVVRGKLRRGLFEKCGVLRWCLVLMCYVARRAVDAISRERCLGDFAPL